MRNFLVVLFVLIITCALAGAQTNSSGIAGTTGSIAGTISDPQGAVIPQAAIVVQREGMEPRDAVSDEQGRFTVGGLAPGIYSVQAQAPGFRVAAKSDVKVSQGAVVRVALALEIDVQNQQVVVSDTDVDSSPDKNGGAIVLKAKDLDALSDDPSLLQTQLQAMAGSDPESGSQIYVDGFSGGKMPPKSSIREIRINSNPYSAQYDELGWGRIEIFTKPGSDKLHGNFWMQGNDSPFNALNPFVTSQPPYYSYQFEGDLSGPVSKAASYFSSLYGQKAVTDSIVNAEVLDSASNEIAFTQAVSSPTSTLNFSPRFDLQLGKVQTLTLRYSLQRNTQTNGGIGQFALASQAFDSDMTEQSLQFSDTQAFGAKVVNETRFQYIRDRNNQTSRSQATTIAVQGGFTGGGNNLGDSHDKQDHYELQDLLQVAAGTHDLNLGARLREVRDANYSTANFNGQYTFASLSAYAANQPSQFTQTQGSPRVVVSLFDAGVYAEDNWKVKPNFTWSYGLRFESQTQLHDHADFGPRTSLNWSISGGKNKPPRAVIRAGAGWFYQRFESANVLIAKRQNGVTETAVVIDSPTFYPGTCSTNPSNCAGSAENSSAATIYQISPTLRAPYTAIGGAGFDLPIAKFASISANYTYQRGEHLFITRNINAPLPGTYNPADPSSGTRPLGTDENIYQYDSDGASERNRLVFNGNAHGKHFQMWGFFMLNKSLANTGGVSSFPSNSYNLHEDYGAGSNNIHRRLFVGGNLTLPWKISMNPMIIAQSGTPFNIVVGQDLNGDTQFNDRPAFATDLSRPSVYQTKYGNFDALPMPGQKIIPINYGHGPALFITNLRLNKEFSFGPKLPEDPAPDAAKPADAKKDATTTTTSTTQNTTAKTPAKPVKKDVERRYTIGIGAVSDNIFNHVNLGPPVGVLGSQLFGKSTALNTVWGDTQSNRMISFNLFFRF